MDSILSTTNLSRVYFDGSGNELRVLTGISVEFQGEVTVSIVGSSGCGKSTLLQILGGLDHPTSGEVLFRGKSIYDYTADELSEWRNRRVGFVFQSHHLLADFTALENVMMPGVILNTPKRCREERAGELLRLVGLGARASHRPDQLSGGERQRVAIARALINSPDIVLADEPTGNLDIKTGERVGELLKGVCLEQKATLIMVTHNERLASDMRYRFHLCDGKLVRKD